MRLAQIVGLGVTAVFVLGVDMPLDWLVLCGMFAGGCANFAVSLWERRNG